MAKRKKPPPATRATIIIAVVKNIGYAIFGLYLIWAQSTQEHPQIAIIAVGLLLCGFPVAEISELLRTMAMDRWADDDDEEGSES